MLYGHAFTKCRFSQDFGPESREDRVKAISLRCAGRCSFGELDARWFTALKA